MKRHFTYEIIEEYNGFTIQQYLKALGYTQHVIILLKQTENGILHNGIWAHVRDQLHTGDVLETLLVETEGSPKIVPVSLPLTILYEDEDILVCDKPADTPVHPSFRNYENTLANAVMHYFHEQNISCTFRCLTRLDRDTTGITLLAKHMLSAGILSEDLQKHDFEKEYLAIVSGHLEGSGTVDAPIARADASAIERCVDQERGEAAVTHYHSERCFEVDGDPVSLLRIKTETGRTHQIRVHMQYIGHPLIGDWLYNPDDHRMDRQALHCSRLGFRHPITGAWMEISSPLPDDMKKILSE